VEKVTQAQRTGATIRRLTGEQREQEMARLLDGSVSAVSLKHAQALLAEHHTTTKNKPKRRKRT